jgi:hypothetical protein
MRHQRRTIQVAARGRTVAALTHARATAAASTANANANQVLPITTAVCVSLPTSVTNPLGPNSTLFFLANADLSQLLAQASARRTAQTMASATMPLATVTRDGEAPTAPCVRARTNATITAPARRASVCAGLGGRARTAPRARAQTTAPATARASTSSVSACRASLALTAPRSLLARHVL